VILKTGGGGGYRPAKERDLAAVKRDLDLGYVTRKAAQTDYGVLVDAQGRAYRKMRKKGAVSAARSKSASKKTTAAKRKRR